MIIRQLVTVLSYKHDTRGRNAYDNAMKQLPASARKHARSAESILGRFSRNANKMMHLSMKIYGVKAAQRELSGVESSLKGVGNTLKALTAGYLGVQGIKQFSSFISTAAGEYEVGMMRLNTMVGEQKAGGVLTQLQAMAAKTPYELNELLDMFTSLQGSGYDLMDRKTGKLHVDKLTAIGDAAAIANKPLSEMKDMILGLGKGQATMFDNFAGAGFAGASASGGSIEGQLADVRTGKMSKFSVDSENKKAILDLIVGQGKSAGVSGGMEKLSETLPGMLSTAQDTMKSFGVSIWEGGLKYPVKSAMTELQKWADETMPNLGQSIGRFMDGGAERLTVWFYKILDFAQAAKPYLKPLAMTLGLIGAHMLGLKVMGSFLQGGVMFKVIGFIMKFKNGIMGFMALAKMAGPMATLGTVFTSIGAALMPLVIGGALAAAAAGIGYLGYKIWEYWQKGDSALDGLREKFPGLADGIKSMGDGLAAWWPELSKSAGIIKDGLIWGLDLVGKAAFWWLETISIPALGMFLRLIGDMLQGFKIMYDWAMPKIAYAFDWWKTSATDFFNYLGEKFPWLSNIIQGIANFTGSLFGDGGNSSGGGSSPGYSPAQGNILETAKRFAIGAPGQSAADKWAKSGDKINGMSVKQLYIKGVACDISTEKVLSDAGVGKQVLDAMVGRVPDSYKNLVDRKLAEEVSYKDLKGGEIFYAPGMTHTGIVGAGGKTLLHAANSQGGKIGMGQRFSSTGNYIGAGGKYLRIKDQYLPQSMPSPQRNAQSGAPNLNANLTQNFYGPVSPSQAGKAAKDGTTQSINKAALNTKKLVPGT